MVEMRHLTMGELEEGLAAVLQAPHDQGIVEMIVRRPQSNEREVVAEATLDVTEGLVGDNWRARGSAQTVDGSSDPECQLNVMNARVIALVAQDKEWWPLAGDQLFIDLDLSAENVPAGTRLALGSSVIEVTARPHTGCKKFVERYGLDAMMFVNSPAGKELHLRGINAKVVQAGVVRAGDVVRKIY